MLIFFEFFWVSIYKTESGCKFGDKCAFVHTAGLMNSLAKSLKRMMTEVLWRHWRIHDNWVTYFRKSSRQSLHQFCGRARESREQSDVWNSRMPHCVMQTFEKAKVHHLEYFVQPFLMSTALMRPNLRTDLKRDGETRAMCPRDAWRLAKSILKLKEKDKATFFSLTEIWCVTDEKYRPSCPLFIDSVDLPDFAQCSFSGHAFALAQV